MIHSTDFFSNLLNALLPNRAAPVLARVIKAHEGAGKTQYSVDVRVVKLGTLEDTDQVISEVPISPIWAGQKKRGVYAIPNEDQVVVVEFLGWNPAYPFVAGIWSDEYESDAFAKDQFIITDGEGMQFRIDAEEKGIIIDNGKIKITLNGDKCAITNGSKSLFTIMDTLLTTLIGMKTVGSPAQHTVFPADIQSLTQTKTDLGQLLEP
jgi:hypothetical protein